MLVGAKFSAERAPGMLKAEEKVFVEKTGAARGFDQKGQKSGVTPELRDKDETVTDFVQPAFD